MRGRTLRVFIMGADPLGLRQVELDNWTGAAVMGTRGELAHARVLPELSSPTVYLLTDTIDGQSDVRRVYVGEADDFNERGIERNERLADWEHFIALYSKDSNLTKAHVRWLEQKIYLKIKEATGRALVANGNTPPGSSLPKADLASMETYLDNMIYMLSALGLDFFSPRKIESAATENISSEATSNISFDPDHDERYTLTTGSNEAAKAIAVRRGQTWILQVGSKLTNNVQGSLSDAYRALRQSFIDDKLVEITEDGYLTVLHPIEFSSPSAPAAIVRGYSVNGKTHWLREKDQKRFSDVLAENV